MVTNIKKYNCEKAFILIDKSEYLELKIKGIKCFKEAKLIEKTLESYESGIILKFRGLQLLGNSLLIKKFGIKSKTRNCQFQYLFEKNILNDIQINNISDLANIRNDMYYQNYSNNEDLLYENYNKINKKINKILDKLIEELEK